MLTKSDKKGIDNTVKPDQRFFWCYLALFPIVFLALGVCALLSADPPLKNTPEDRGLLMSVVAWNNWRMENRGNGYIMRGRNLSSLNLDAVDVKGTDLLHGNLDDATLRKADLTEAILGQGSLIGTDLSDAQLRGAFVSLSNLKGAILTNVDARNASFDESDLSGADLRGGDFSGASFITADLSGANLSGANFSGANLWGANLTGATGWMSIESVACANIHRAGGPNGFRKWAHSHGAVEFGEYREPESNWFKVRDECLERLEKGEGTHVE
jgi:hypothetical protein